jgi:hypothetical protein
MGEGTARLEETRAPRPAGTTRAVDAGTGATRVRALGEEIEEVRARLDVLADELDRRRHAAFDWRRQLRRHAKGIALAMLGLAALTAAGMVVRAKVSARTRPRRSRRD